MTGKFRILFSILTISLLITSLVLAEDFVILPVEIGSPANFSICHPSERWIEGGTLAADFVADRTVGDAPLTVRFYDISYGFPDYWEWDFGDGTFSYEPNPVHIYPDPGTYDVSLRVWNGVSYETLATDYNRTRKGQFTDIKWQSTDREIEYITVNKAGSGTDQEVPPGWYPEPSNIVEMPSGLTGARGNVALEAATITITPTTQKGYTSSMNINGIYRVHTSIPYNTGY